MATPMSITPTSNLPQSRSFIKNNAEGQTIVLQVSKLAQMKVVRSYSRFCGVGKV